MDCRICSTPVVTFARAQVLGKYQIEYYRCPNCEFIQTEDPYWLTEAYESAIIQSDVGLVARNLHLSLVCQSLLRTLRLDSGTYLDYGGGYGLFVRLMRDAGYDFWLYDKYCVNLFAPRRTADLTKSAGYTLVTAFECFEHWAQPIDEMKRLLELAPNILFTTELVPDPPPLPDNWWYYALDGGQHISLYTRKSLIHLARDLGLHLRSNGRSLHWLSREPVSPWLFRLASSRLARAISAFGRHTSLTPEDYFQVTRRRLDD